MYKYKYNKYKKKYIDLKNKINEGGIIIRSEYDESFAQDDRLIEPINDERPYYFRVADKTTLNIYDHTNPRDKLREEYKSNYPKYENIVKLKPDDLYNYSTDDFIKLEDEPNDKKILRIDNLDDFDTFTEKYGRIRLIKDIDSIYNEKVIVINYKKLSKLYKGIYINQGLESDRQNIVYYKGKTYKSWWSSDITSDKVLLFDI